MGSLLHLVSTDFKTNYLRSLETVQLESWQQAINGLNVGGDFALHSVGQASVSASGSMSATSFSDLEVEAANMITIAAPLVEGSIGSLHVDALESVDVRALDSVAVATEISHLMHLATARLQLTRHC